MTTTSTSSTSAPSTQSAVATIALPPTPHAATSAPARLSQGASSSSSSSPSSQAAGAAQSASTSSAVFRVFSIAVLHIHIRSFLGDELTADALVSSTWGSLTPRALIDHHVNRLGLEVLRVMFHFPRTSSTPEGVLRYAGGKFPKLTSLDLSNCTEGAIAALIAPDIQAPILAELNLGGCTSTNEDTLAALSKFAYLTSLNLSECPKIDRQATGVLAVSCPNLTFLNLSWCPKADVDAMRCTLIVFRNLTSLNLAGYHGDRKGVMQVLPAVFPRLTSLILSEDCRKFIPVATQITVTFLPPTV